MTLIVGIGAAAGLVSALLFAVITTGNTLALLLYFVAPLPILLAALGWNHRAGLVAALVGSAVIAVVFRPVAGLAFLISVAVPAWWYAYLALLARTDETGTEWYPLGRLLVWIAGVSAGLTLAGAMTLGGTYEEFVRAFMRAVRIIETINPRAFEGLTGDARAQSIAELARLLAFLAPPVSAATGVGMAVLLVWSAAKITAVSDRLPRPWPALPDTEMPRTTMAILGIATVLGVLLDGFAGLGARSVAAALLMAYCLQGLAVIHVLTRGMSGRTGMLAGVYIIFVVLPGWPVLLYAVVGLADAVFGLRARKRGRGPPLRPSP